MRSRGSVQKMAITTISHRALSLRLNGQRPEEDACAINGAGACGVRAAMP
jgi:hypothetical protein